MPSSLPLSLSKDSRPRVLSAMQPTQGLHLGNYLGALRNWVPMQNDTQCLFFAVDLHAITVRQDPKELRKNTLRAMAYYFAAGIDPTRSICFVQSHVPEHSELAWLLLCSTYMGELNRMTQFKDKSKNQGTNIGAGLFTYPTLMAADILLYQTHKVPVGEDQKQHLELTRDLAERMNSMTGQKLFRVPEPFIAKIGARIMSLQSPEQKMSKSDPLPGATVFLHDTADEITKKIKRAVTDSGSTIEWSEEKPGIRNLLSIQSAISGELPEALVAKYAGKMYGHLKVDTAEIVAEHLRPIRERAETFLKDEEELSRILARGASQAREIAQETMSSVREALGLLPR